MDIKDTYFFISPWTGNFTISWPLSSGRGFHVQFLPFGLSPASRAFTRVIKPIKAHLHQLADIFFFLDDFHLASRRVLLLQKTDLFLLTLKDLGFRINARMSSLCPAQSLVFLAIQMGLEGLVLVRPTGQGQMHSPSALWQEVHFGYPAESWNTWWGL